MIKVNSDIEGFMYIDWFTRRSVQNKFPTQFRNDTRRSYYCWISETSSVQNNEFMIVSKMISPHILHSAYSGNLVREGHLCALCLMMSQIRLSG